jgi:hypothetical protein
MKVIITESKLKTFIKNNLNIDLTGKIEEITSAYRLLNDFDMCFSYHYLREKLNKYGPIYLITLNDKTKILYQLNMDSRQVFIVSNGCDYYDEREFMELLGDGLYDLGVKFEQLKDIYLTNE